MTWDRLEIMANRTSNACWVRRAGEHRTLAFDADDVGVAETDAAGTVGVVAAGTGTAVVLAVHCSSSHSLVWSGVASERSGCERCFLLLGGGKARPVASPQRSLRTSTRSMGNSTSRRLVS